MVKPLWRAVCDEHFAATGLMSVALWMMEDCQNVLAGNNNKFWLLSVKALPEKKYLLR